MTDLLLTLPTGVQKRSIQMTGNRLGRTNTRAPEEKEKSKKERLLNLNTERREENQEAEERAIGEQTSLSFWPVKL
jgi:hypothetical protein